jgi:hypothetical protein
MEDAEQQIIRQTIHDLRNIFCVVIGNLELLRSCVDPNSTKLIDRAMNGAVRGDAIIATLAALTHADQRQAAE